ncbi:MAG: 3-methyl-2-oxobutanoate hydroxymethyltransferase [Actinomycetota bacterium]
MSKVTVPDLLEMKAKGEKITMLTAYDYITAAAIDEVGIDIILVGDSLGMVVLGYDNTLAVTMEDMLHHTRPVARAVRRAMVVGDMPFMSFQVSAEEAMRNAGRFVQEAGAEAVKLEGGEEVAETTRRIVDMGVPVMGHLGLTPQSVHQLGGFKLQAKTIEQAKKLIKDAKILEKAGCFSIVLEKVPAQVAKIVTETVSIPTIGIGAGVFCDGQVLVTPDLLGLYEKFVPKFVKQYARLGPAIKSALRDYVKEVKKGKFPTEEHSFFASEEVIQALKEAP